MSIFEDLLDDKGQRKYPKTWEKLFEDNWHLLEKVQKYIDSTSETFYPKPKEIFKAFKITPVDSIKVIILAQDPYHTTNDDGTPVAMGLAFSVRKGSPIAKSLNNIFKVVAKNIGENSQCVKTGDLTPWAKQGIFLLNACLTVTPGNAGSHGNIWYGFIKRTLEFIFKHTVDLPIDLKKLDISSDEDEENEEDTESVDKKENEKDKYPIALLWGAKAQEYETFCRGVVMKTSHPSPFSAARGFMDCKHFKDVNKLLKMKGMKQIEW